MKTPVFIMFNLNTEPVTKAFTHLCPSADLERLHQNSTCCLTVYLQWLADILFLSMLRGEVHLWTDMVHCYLKEEVGFLLQK